MRKHDNRWMRHGPEALVALAEAEFRKVEAVHCPVLIVRGGLSDVFHDEDAAAFAASLPNGRWVRVGNDGHTVQGDNPRGLVEARETFLFQLGA